MANPEHVKKLLEGREVWNAWRDTHPRIRPDLSWASLRGADLSRYVLDHVDFSDADLRDVSLNFCSLNGALFVGTDLERADFSDAMLGFTVFATTSLARTKGLESVHHFNHSPVAIDTLFLSQGLPEDFLRGCGIPDEFITYAGSLIGKPIEYYSCFISYSRRDNEFSRRVYADLQARSIRTWFAPEDLKIGDRFRSRIDESIRVHDKLVLILSEHSINSAWVQREVETALEREDKEKRDLLFPIRLDDSVFDSDASWARDVCRRHIGDFHNWKNHDDYTKAFDRLVKDLKKEGPIIMR